MAKEQNRYDAKKVSATKVAKWLTQSGYEVEFLSQKWRHLVAKIYKDPDEPLLIKLASSEGASRATKNEVKWNNAINKQLNARSSFSVPKVYADGLYRGKYYYFICDFVVGRPLFRRSQALSAEPRFFHAEAVVNMLCTLRSLKMPTLAWDYIYRQEKEPGLRFFNRSLWYQNEINRKDTKKLLPLAEAVKERFKPSLSHGDFTPWHIFTDDVFRLTLIDAEMATKWHPLYYDLAFFYQRVFTVLNQPDFAREVASLYYQRLSKSEKKNFLPTFMPILAERTMGSFWDVICASKKKRKELAFNKLLLKATLEGDIF